MRFKVYLPLSAVLFISQEGVCQKLHIFHASEEGNHDDCQLVCRLPFKLPRNDDGPPGYVDWLYLDDNLRITQGSRGSLFVHTREELE